MCSHSARSCSCSAVQLGQYAFICSPVIPWRACAIESTYHGSFDGYARRPGPDTGGSTIASRASPASPVRAARIPMRAPIEWPTTL
ncbi:Uncharacterised protein [Bordetella pertussis]|uniref:Uncharacterized protein n=1 Tax=Bordetella pertussis TaxID=520 RepID=A0A0E8EIN1_BORPT|nr:Uncharacterised protein [Bordetella pertussis]CFD87504.1 Uncharacterised protein [Bordetella pertussis]CFE01984.1 Uncharacterised protein [Bordetella pertussis]CFL77047.1 Uncharacterised protein [Bordetella pertussis]CFL82902.1 Uncharacterised protein [Bordetella pertussis]